VAFAKCLKRELGTKSLFLRKRKPATKVVGFFISVMSIVYYRKMNEIKKEAA
jgi:hypothetical protein